MQRMTTRPWRAARPALAPLRATVIATPAPAGARTPCRRTRAVAEALEGRTLLAVAPVGEPFLVHTTLPHDQNTNAGGRDVAADSQGNFLAAWTSRGQGGEWGEVYARRFTAAGTPLGQEFHVNTTTEGDQDQPAVAMNGDGRFVVVWVDRPPGTHFSLGNVTAQVYDPAGRRVGGEVRVSGPLDREPWPGSERLAPAVAMDGDGNFVVAWAAQGVDSGGAWAVVARRFDRWGAPRGEAFRVNSRDPDDQFKPDVASDVAGNFTVVFVDNHRDGDQGSIAARRYDASGAPLGDDFLVNTTTAGYQLDPTVAMDPDGDTVVAWTSYGRVGQVLPPDGVYARRFDRSGNAAGPDFRVSGDHGGGLLSLLPSVSADAAGNFVVAYSAADADDFGVYYRRFDAGGAAGEILPVNTHTASVQRNPSVAMDADGDFVVTFSSYAQANPSDYGVYARVYAESRDALPPAVLSVTGAGAPVEAGGTLTHSVSQFVVSFSEPLVDADGRVDSVTNLSNWTLGGGGFGAEYPRVVTVARNPDTGRYEATLHLSRALPSMDWVLTLDDAIADPAGNRLDGDGDGAAGGDFVLPFTVAVPVAAADAHVNTYAHGPQQTRVANPRSIAADAAGNYVVVYCGYPPDPNRTDDDVFVRRYDRHGRPLTDPVAVTDTPFNGEGSASVASDAAGNVVVVWTVFEGSGAGVTARRYNASLQPLGPAFPVNVFRPGDQHSGRVAMDAAGNFVVAWTSDGQDGSGAGVYARRFDAGGLPRGEEFAVNTFTEGAQHEPTVASDASGRFVVAWTSAGQDGSGDGVYARGFDAAGRAFGPEFQVGGPAETARAQNKPVAALDAGGRAVVAFIHDSQAYAYWFGLNGVRLGGGRASEAGYPVRKLEVAMSPAGDAVITWDTAEIWARRFGPGGVPAGASFVARPYEGYVVDAPSVAVAATGEFAIAYTLRVPDATSDEVFVRPFVAPPVADVVDVAPDPHAGPVDRVVVRFTEPVTGVDLSDFELTYFPPNSGAGTDVPLTAAQSLTAAPGGAEYVLGNLSPLTATAGHYWLALRGRSGIASVAGMPLAGRAMDAWTVTAAARVVARHAFYNNSAFDGGDPAPNAADDAAIATDKNALLANQDRLPAFDNVTSYEKGLNGVMVDVNSLPIIDARLDARDFDFGGGPAPVSVTVRPGAGAGGSDRVTLVWRDYNPLDTSPLPQAVANGWLTITVKANAHTGLAAPDVFSFGNLIAETNGVPGPDGRLRVNALDVAAVKRGLTTTTVPVTTAADLNRDGRVNALDVAAVKRNLTRTLPLTGVATPAPVFADSGAAGTPRTRRVWYELA